MPNTFTKGGIHPAENKISAGQKIQELPLPETVFIPVSQHIGAPAKTIVQKGDKVKAGQVIAEPAGFVSTNIHATVSGTVNKIDKVTDASGYKKETVVIAVEGDEWAEGIDLSKNIVKDTKSGQEEIIKKILDAGVVGLGGATFPSHVKLSLPKGKTATHLIINGVECEPYLTSDDAMMMEKGKEILIGASILMKGLNVENCIIGIEKNKPGAIAKMTELAKEFKGIRILGLKVKYPQGGEKQLIKAAINREVPSGGLPVDVGTVVFNVGTTYAVYEAVQKNKPLVERVVTITGKNMKQPANYKVRIGTPVQALIDAAGGLPKNTGKIINGGPMMGKALANAEIPVVKGTSGILIMPENESARKEMKACIRCSKCLEACPMGLEPYLLMSLCQKEMWEAAENERIMDCIECGSCAYICPSFRHLLDHIRLGKGKVSQIIRSRKK